LGHRITITVIGRSDIGRIRNRNEDSISLVPELGIAVLADGMGGHPGGDVASRIACETASEHLRHRLPFAPGLDVEDVEERLSRTMAESVLWAHNAVRSEGAKDAVLEGMGTTLTAFASDPESGVYVIGSVGDSRAYLLRDGDLRQLTRDDTWVQQRVDAADLTPEQARRHPFGHMLTQCIGLATPPDPHVVTGRLKPGDRFLLCTDGLTGMLSDEEIREALLDGGGEAAAADPGQHVLETLVAGANDAGGHDNVTVALVTVTD
jgi:protein phosphatase